MTQSKKSKEVLGVLFPEREVILGGDVAVKVRPLSLKDLPKVIDSFADLMKMSSDGMSNTELAIRGIVQLLELVPFCLDMTADKIPTTKLPDILEVIIEQNFTEEVMGKWKALAEKAGVKDLLSRGAALKKL